MTRCGTARDGLVRVRGRRGFDSLGGLSTARCGHSAAVSETGPGREDARDRAVQPTMTATDSEAGEPQETDVQELSDTELKEKIRQTAAELYRSSLDGQAGDALSELCHPADERSTPPACLSDGSGGHDSVMDEAIGWGEEYADSNGRLSEVAARFAALCDEAERRHHAAVDATEVGEA